jgi:hypothetical protein
MPKQTAMSAKHTALVSALVLSGGLLLAEELEQPDAEFLEYLGLWEGSDEDWLIFDEPVVAETDERSDPAPKGEESAETKDES